MAFAFVFGLGLAELLVLGALGVAAVVGVVVLIVSVSQRGNDSRRRTEADDEQRDER